MDWNWAGIRSFFEQKLPELKPARDKASGADDDQSRLNGVVLDEVIETLERQLSEIEFFQNSDEAGPAKSDVSKLEYAPLTNLGCESEFAKLDVRIAVSGGSTAVQTHSCKNMVTTNLLLTDPSFSKLGSTEKQQKWKWARTSRMWLLSRPLRPTTYRL